VLCHFGRHEAPVLRVPQGLAQGEWVYVFQGVLSNQHSQPVLVDWFGVRTGAAGAGSAGPAGTVVSLRDLSALVGLGGPLVNRGEPVDPALLKAHVGAAVSAADEHMKALRARRAKQLLPQLKQQQQRLEAWRSARAERQERRASESQRDGRGPTRPQQAKWQEEQAHTERVVRDRKAWLDRLKTSDTPYLRLALVIGSASAGNTAPGRSAQKGKR
jgi:hypothetical protein